MVADGTDRLQQVIDLVPARYSPYLPMIYGTCGLLALLLLNSAHKDELERASVARPRITMEWLQDASASPYNAIRIHNDGPTAAYNVEAVAWINENYAIRIEPLPLVTAQDGVRIVPVIDNGPRQPVTSHAHMIKFLRIAMGWDKPEARELRKQLTQYHSITRLMRFEPPPPDLEVPFGVTYTDFHGRAYSTQHTLAYFDEQGRICVTLDRGP